MGSKADTMNKIKAYSFGTISIDGHLYESDIIIHPDRVQEEWRRKEGHRLQLDDISELLANPPEVLVVGQGAYGRMQLDPRVSKELNKLKVQLIAEPTKNACDRFNELLESGRNVVAALHLTC
jgi:hypothetical protein